MPVRRTSIQRTKAGTHDGIGPERMSISVLQDRYCFETFMQQPFAYKVPAEGAGIVAPAGTALQSCVVDTQRNKFLFATLVDETDQFLPILATDGGYNWIIPGTPVLNDAIEINFAGSDLASAPRNVKPSQEDCFARVLLRTEDASGSDIFFGYRRVGTVVAGYTDITDLFGVRILGNSGSTDAVFSILTQLNNTSSDVVETSVSVTGLEDDTNIELEVRAVGGKLFVLVNGVAVAGAPAFTADSGDAFSPVLRITETTDVTAYVKTFVYEGGLLVSRQQGTLSSLARTTS
jgi:hypothetical protein